MFGMNDPPGPRSTHILANGSGLEPSDESDRLISDATREYVIVAYTNYRSKFPQPADPLPSGGTVSAALVIMSCLLDAANTQANIQPIHHLLQGIPTWPPRLQSRF